MPCLTGVDQQIAMSVQIADEGRHAYFFERFFAEVMSTAPTSIPDPLKLSPIYQNIFFDSVDDLVDRAAAERTADSLAPASFQIFILLEGSAALASMHVIRKLLTHTKRFPGLLEGLTHCHRDEARHAQFGLALLHDLLAANPAARSAVADHLHAQLPSFSEMFKLHPERKAVLEALGLNPYERRERAFALLRRHLQTLGIAADCTALTRAAA